MGRLRRIILNFLKGNWVGWLLLAADLSGYWYDRSFLLQDLHFNGCDGLVALPGGFEAFPRHCVVLPVLNALFQSFLSVASGLQCVAVLIATQNVPTQPVPLSGRRKYFQNVRAFIFFPQKKKKKKKKKS